MTKRPNGEGSVYRRRDGRWAAALVLPDGSRKTLYGRTRQEVAGRLSAALGSVSIGLPLPSGRETLTGFWHAWLAGVRTNLRPRTWTRYEQLGRVHLLPVLGRIKLSRIGPMHIRSLHEAILAKGISPSTAHHAHAVLHRALADAVRWGLLMRNPADLVPAPRLAAHEPVVLSDGQARTLCTAAAGDRLETLYVLAITTGMRQGELLALKWREVDCEAGTLRVTGTLQRSEGRMTLSEPKTPRSRRQVALAEQAVEALRRHRARQTEDRLRLGAAWDDSDLVFTNGHGGPLEAAHVVNFGFRPLLARAGLPAIRFHDLRHSAATLLLSRGVHPKIASEMLGHASTGVTLDRYSHVSETMQREAAQVMTRLLGGR
ncbi:MAG TPA: site-specific integrase [Verrucomicrobiae bacterium]|nr:site-specific integrase [Verrucomicrobiae bacterium]